MYDIFPPAFYEALLEHNTDSDKKKLWLIQGVWPPDENWSLDEAYENAFIQKLSKAVDVIHGRIQDDYSADISKYVLAFIFGKEWEPDVVFKNDNNNSSNTEYSGDYFLVEKGTPTECFLAKLCDALMRYESETYGWQRPVSFINWPTLDPIYHPTEHEPEEDIPSYLAKHRWHNDTATINFSNIKPTRSNEAGFFASYHIYPWNPDFMNNDPDYSRYLDRLSRPDNLAGYLNQLKTYHPEIPIVVAEFGVPTSRGNASSQPQNMNHGHHTETEQGLINSRMIQNIHNEGFAGGIVFNWIDEWWKTCWLVNGFELHSGGNDRFWHNAQDPEEHFGILAIESDYKILIDGNQQDWSEPFQWDLENDQILLRNDGYDDSRDLRALSLASDHTYLYIKLDVANLDCDENGEPDWEKVS